MKKPITLLLISLFTLHASLAQQYGWTDISANIPDTLGYDLWGLSDVSFVSENEGWISDSWAAIILHTTDGGATFEIQETSLGTSTEAIYMIDENEGYTGGGSGFVYRTTNGGLNWDLLGTIPSTLTDLDFANATQGYACGLNGAVFSITPAGVTNLNSGLTTGLAGISSPSENNVLVCGGSSISHYNGSIFEFQSGPAGTYNAIFFINDNEGWILGNGGLMGHTEDDGENWKRQINPDSNSLYDLFFLDENKGWAVGVQGTILKTTNGGDTWTVDEEGSALAGTNFLRGVYFTSPTNGYVVGNDKTLLKYTEVSGIAEGIETLRFDIFPNPAVETISLQLVPQSEAISGSAVFSRQPAVVEVYDLNGRKLLEKHIAKGQALTEIDVSDLESGMYLVFIQSDNQIRTKKLIIQK